MNRLLIALILTATPVVHAAEVKKDEGSGLYFARYNEGSFYYFVDPETQLCFASGQGAHSMIPCQALARRREWKPVITWVDQK